MHAERLNIARGKDEARGGGFANALRAGRTLSRVPSWEPAISLHLGLDSSGILVHDL